MTMMRIQLAFIILVFLDDDAAKIVDFFEMLSEIVTDIHRFFLILATFFNENDLAYF